MHCVTFLKMENLKPAVTLASCLTSFGFSHPLSLNGVAMRVKETNKGPQSLSETLGNRVPEFASLLFHVLAVLFQNLSS